MSERRNTGLMPSAETQIMVTAAIGAFAHHYARRQAQMGVDPRIAAQRGVNSANAVVCWALFMLPMMGLAGLFALASPLGAFLAFPIEVLGLIITVRMHRYVSTRGDVQHEYAIPTWVLVVLGGLWVTLYWTLAFVSAALRTG